MQSKKRSIATTKTPTLLIMPAQTVQKMKAVSRDSFTAVLKRIIDKVPTSPNTKANS